MYYVFLLEQEKEIDMLWSKKFNKCKKAEILSYLLSDNVFMADLKLLTNTITTVPLWISMHFSNKMSLNDISLM